MWKQTLILGVLLLFISGCAVNQLDGVDVYPDTSYPESVKQYLKEEPEFNFNSPSLQLVVASLNSSNPSVRVKNVLNYVYNRVDYVVFDAGYCFAETASLVNEVGRGSCVSASRLTVALLRGVGVPSRTVGGCASSLVGCNGLFAVYKGGGVRRFYPEKAPQGTLLKLGGNEWDLHEWVEAYIDGRWVILEPLLGKSGVFDKSCGDYVFFSYDSNAYERCVIDDLTFASNCKTGNLRG